MHSRDLALLAAAGFASVCLFWGPPSAASTEDVAFQIDVAHSGSTQFTNFTTPLTLKWNVDLKGIVGYPVIAKGKVFVTVSNSPTSSRLVALDLGSGKILWQHAIPNDLAQLSNIAYDNGILFDLNTEGLLQAFNPKSGKVKWQLQLQNNDQTYSPPIATGGLVYINGAGVGATVYAIDEQTGNPIWTQDVEGTDFGAPAYGNNGLYLAYGCDDYKLNATTGAILWHNYYDCGGGSGLTPIYTGKLLYARSNATSDLILLTKNGKTKGLFAADWPPAFFTDSQGNFREAVTYGGVLYCVDTKTQLVVWAFEGDANLNTSPLIINGQVVEGSSQGNIYVLDGDSGNLTWTTNAGSAIFSPYELSPNEGLVGMGAGEETLIVPATDNLLAFASE